MHLIDRKEHQANRLQINEDLYDREAHARVRHHMPLTSPHQDLLAYLL